MLPLLLCCCAAAAAAALTPPSITHTHTHTHHRAAAGVLSTAVSSRPLPFPPPSLTPPCWLLAGPVSTRSPSILPHNPPSHTHTACALSSTHKLLPSTPFPPRHPHRPHVAPGLLPSRPPSRSLSPTPTLTLTPSHQVACSPPAICPHSATRPPSPQPTHPPYFWKPASCMSAAGVCTSAALHRCVHRPSLRQLAT